MATLLAPEDQVVKRIKGKDWRKVARITFDEYWHSPIVGAFDAQSILTQVGKANGLAALYDVWEPITTGLRYE